MQIMSERSVQSFGDLERWEGGFPGEHEFSTLEQLKQFSDGSTGLDTLLDASQRLVGSWGGNRFAGLYLYGTPGTGKTHAAMGLGRLLHDEIGAEIHYRYVPMEKSASISNFNAPRYGHSGLRSQDKSVFPYDYRDGASRNPKSVLILDDYQPDSHDYVARAIEAGAQFGGLVVVTSNYEDPFKLLENGESITPEQIVVEDLAQRTNPEAAAAHAEQQQKRSQEMQASLRSRIAAGIKFIEFSGPDHRVENSFWN